MQPETVVQARPGLPHRAPAFQYPMGDAVLLQLLRRGEARRPRANYDDRESLSHERSSRTPRNGAGQAVRLPP
jgi:hypothetical protein